MNLIDTMIMQGKVIVVPTEEYDKFRLERDALHKQLDVAMRGLGEIQQRYKNGIGFGAGLVATSTLAECEKLRYEEV